MVADAVELAKTDGRGAGHGLVNAVLRRATREGAALLAALDDGTPRARRDHALPPASGSRGCGGRSWAPPTRGRCWPATTSPGSWRCARTRCSATPRRWRRSCRSPTPRRPGAARGARPRGPSGRARLAAVARRGVHRAVARGDAGRARAGPRAGRAGARPVRGPGRQEHPPRGADGGPRGGRRGRAQPAGARRSCSAPRERLRAGHRARGARRRRAARARTGRRSTACSWTRRARGSGPCRRAPTCAGGSHRRASARWRATQAAILAAGAAAVRPGGVLVYSTCTISPTENERQIAAFLDSHPDFTLDDLGAELPVVRASQRAALRADAAPPRPHRRLLHRAAAPGLSAMERARPAARRSRPALPELLRAVAAPDEPAGSLPLRVLPAPLRAGLGVPELRRALDDRAHVLDRDRQVQQLRRQHAPPDLSVVGVGVDMSASANELLRGVRVAPSILVRRLRAAARAGARGAGRGRARDPRGRDGRALRAADHDRPAGRGGAARAGRRRRGRCSTCT